MNFVVVSEARADFTTATELADRVLVEAIEWMEEGLLDSQRQWIGEDLPGYHLAWTTVAQRARELGIRAQGHFNGEPGLPDAHAARRALLYVRQKFDTPDAIVLVRDIDDQGERRQGLEQARADDRSEIVIVIGVACAMRECWVICGFVPNGEDEEQLLASERQQLGSNPCLRSHDLTAKSEIAVHNAKRVLKALTQDDWDRQQQCWRDTELNVLRDRGEENGLSAYLTEVQERLAPLFAAPGRRA